MKKEIKSNHKDNMTIRKYRNLSEVSKGERTTDVLSVEVTKYGIRIGIIAFITLITKVLRHVEYPMRRVWE